MNKGKTMIWSASAMMANTIAARKREPGEIMMVSLATAVLPSCSMPILNRWAAYRTATDDAHIAAESPTVARSRVASTPTELGTERSISTDATEIKLHANCIHNM